MLKDRLKSALAEANKTEMCRLAQVASDMDDETRTVFISVLQNRAISGRSIWSTLRDEGITVSRETINVQRKCMTTEACTCPWENLS